MDNSSQNQRERGRLEAFGDARLARLGRALSELEFKQVFLNDEQAIDELTEIDEWHISKKSTLEKLQEGWNCYVLQREGKIVASSWVCNYQSFFEPYMKREFKLAADEVYHWRAYTVPGVRGKGIMPWLSKNVICHLAESCGKRRHVMIVRVENKTIQRIAGKLGWSKVGRAGFYEIFGFRFHYLLGRKAFSATRRRIFIQRQKRQ